jgi:hypothetical protein
VFEWFSFSIVNFIFYWNILVWNAEFNLSSVVRIIKLFSVKSTNRKEV